MNYKPLLLWIVFVSALTWFILIPMIFNIDKDPELPDNIEDKIGMFYPGAYDYNMIDAAYGMRLLTTDTTYIVIDSIYAVDNEAYYFIPLGDTTHESINFTEVLGIFFIIKDGQ
jgi:hypothetical protein